MYRIIKYLAVFALIVVFVSCSPVVVNFRYLQPATINLPQSVQSIVVVDHSAMKNSTWDVIEGGLTGEGIGQDVEAILQFINGIKEIGMQSNRFVLSKESQRYGKGKLLENIPEPMDLALIKTIATKHQADAVLSLDKYDTDFIVTNARLEDEKDPKDTTKTRPRYQVKGISTVTLYIRIYQAGSGEILDEMKVKKVSEFTATGTTVAEAMLQLIAKQDAINRVSYMAGNEYGRRIAPAEVLVSRRVLNKPKKDGNLTRGVRKCQVSDWESAINDFKGAMKLGDDKVAGRAAYNVAICYEGLGNLAEAAKWAQKSYIEYGEKRGKAYYDILAQRIIDEQRLIEQMRRDD